jgi:hypothetical protein
MQLDSSSRFLCPSRISSVHRAACVIVVACLFAALSAAGASVEQWGVFELTLKGPSKGNPFTNVTLSARFTQGTNAMVANGFYDGDGIYRVRFMPETQGKWAYRTASNVRKLDGRNGSFTVTAPSLENHGPVRVAHTFHFAYADGQPYEELGTTCYVWEWQPEALQQQTLNTLAGAPFNKLRMCVFPKHYVWNTNEPVLYPFPGTRAAKDWDFTRFNEKYFQHLEQRVRDLQKLGIEADIILFHPYDTGYWGFDRMPADADDRYLHYVVARLSAYRNVWWSLANEWDFMKRKKESDFVRFGEIVSHDDPYHHLLSIHQGNKLFDHHLPWITHASIQNGDAVTDPGRARAFRDTYQKPVVYDEVQYEGNIPSGWGRLSAEELVFRFWNATVAGTYCGHGETFKSDDQVLWWSKGGVLKGQSPARLAFLKRVLADAPAEGIEPMDHQPGCGGQPGNYYLVYFGKKSPASWAFAIPPFPAGASPGGENLKFTAEVLDTWNMTVAPVPGEFTLKKMDDGSYAEATGRSIPLPGKPYIAIRIKRAGG